MCLSPLFSANVTAAADLLPTLSSREGPRQLQTTFFSSFSQIVCVTYEPARIESGGQGGNVPRIIPRCLISSCFNFSFRDEL
ncbi:hypothetical protein CDAR_373811 [Caerostris darwini]|uniref:Secreted protein n=1 Tax=Caerostris darwini TaxID=1538125 RepID=A0AAV4QIG7_9ARAC|nr:hypothetical protein CDAR_373811 [Caerostris darwini]